MEKTLFSLNIQYALVNWRKDQQYYQTQMIWKELVASHQ